MCPCTSLFPLHVIGKWRAIYTLHRREWLGLCLHTSCWFVLRFYGPVNPMENDRRKCFMINLHEKMLPTSAGVEPATSWSPVGRRIHLCHRGRLHLVNTVYSMNQLAIRNDSLGAFWIANGAKFLLADNEDTNQTARKLRLISVFI